MKKRKIEQTDSIVDSVIDQFIERAKFGKEKYNTDLDRTDLSILDWLTRTHGCYTLFRENRKNNKGLICIIK